ncbi:hypothetical protein RB595_009540 [Gaeumannomyces hyphopodioides]
MESRWQGQGRSIYRVPTYQGDSGSRFSDEPEPIEGFAPSDVNSAAYNASARGPQRLARGGPGQYFRDSRPSFGPGDRPPSGQASTNGQSLREWLDQDLAPDTLEGIRQIWSGLARLCQSLDSPLTGCRNSAQFRSPGADVRQDFTPANIFVVSAPYDPSSSGSQYDGGKIDFKLGDPGRSRHPQARVDLKTPHPWSPSNYVAPEQFIGHGDDAYVFGLTNGSTDLWSLSCLMLEIAVWLAGGAQAAAKFCRDRVEENKQSGRFPISPSIVGYEGCFHDGEELLESVKDIGRWTDRSRGVFAGITGKIVDFLIEHVLVNKNQRPDANSTARRLQDIIDARNNIPGPLSPAAPSSSAPRKSRADSGVSWRVDGPAARPSFTKSDTAKSPSPRGERTRALPVRKPPKHSEVTVDYVIDYRSAWKRSREPDPLNVMDPFFADVEKELDGRDQIFLIDDHSDMSEHAGQLKRTLEAIVKVVKHVDRDGLEVRFASAPTKKHTISVATQVSWLLKMNGPGRDPTMGPEAMAKAVGAILDDVLAKNAPPPPPRHHHVFSWSSYGAAARPPPGTNIYIMTSGVWGRPEGVSGDATLGVARAIRAFIRAQQEAERPSTNTVIQMVSFGRKQVGLDRLRRLDDDLWGGAHGDEDNSDGGGHGYYDDENYRGDGDEGEEKSGACWDIVDTKAHTACMWSILLGAMDKQEDARPANHRAFVSGL